MNTGLASSAPPAPVTSMPASVTAPVRPLKLVTLAAGSAAMEDAMVDTTNAVVAMDVSLSPGDGVGALGLPVNVGEASGAPPTDVTSSRLNSTAPVRVLKLITPSAAATTALETNSVISLYSNVRLMGLASVMPHYILQILGNDPGLKAIPLREPELAHSVGLVTQDRDPSAPLVRAFREAAAAFSVKNF